MGRAAKGFYVQDERYVVGAWMRRNDLVFRTNGMSWAHGCPRPFAVLTGRLCAGTTFSAFCSCLKKTLIAVFNTDYVKM
ncbi:MAG: hypothetical protein ACI845_003337, partial [Gammaproteobacteria bacterium]